MSVVRRATGPLLTAWLVTTLGAVGLAWLVVYPVANLGFADRPPVPHPVIGEPPPFDSNDASESLSRRIGGPVYAPRLLVSPSRRPTTPTRSANPTTAPPRGTTGPQPSPSATATSSPPTVATTSAAPRSDPAIVYQDATAVGGTATFEYAYGSDVYLHNVQPDPGWQVSAYRYYRDWIVVEFLTQGHRSTLHAYLDQGQPQVCVIEEDTA